MTKILHFDSRQQQEMLDLITQLMEKTEESLQRVAHLKNLNTKLLERLNEKTIEFNQEFSIMTDMIVKNQIDYEDELYEVLLEKRVRGGFLHEAPF